MTNDERFEQIGPQFERIRDNFLVIEATLRQSGENFRQIGEDLKTSQRNIDTLYATVKELAAR
jgi:hypothetical protein